MSRSQLLQACISIFCLAIFFTPTRAAQFSVADGDIPGLIAAINAANSNGEADTIELATNGNYTFTSSYQDVLTNGGSLNNGGVALPQLTSFDWPNVATHDLTIEGNGATFIRESSSPHFRFIYLHVTASVIIRDLNFSGGLGKWRGGAIYGGWRSRLTLERCTFTGNRTEQNQGTFDQGGGAVMLSSEGAVTITDCTFTDNHAQDLPSSSSGNGGGAVMVLLSDVSITGSTFYQNTSSNNAGAVYIDGANGNTGTILIQDCDFSSNQSGNGSGALLNYFYNQNTSLIKGCNFRNNSCSAGHGGAIYVGASEITHSGYTAVGNQTSILIENSSIVENTSGENTGGIFVNESHTVLSNSTISGNSAPGLASGLFVGINRLSFALENCTIAYNTSSGSAVGIFIATPANHAGATESIRDTIVAFNDNRNLSYAAYNEFSVSGYNLQYPDDTLSGIAVADPLLASLHEDNGTWIHPIFPTSPARDSSSNAESQDQRGISRNGIRDVGAYEFEPSALSSLDAWRFTHGLDLFETGNGLLTADPDGDSLVNLFEYGLGGAPLAADTSILPQLYVEGTDSRFEFFRAQSALKYEILATSDLLDPDSWVVISTNPGVVATDVQYTEMDILTSQKARFYSLRISQ